MESYSSRNWAYLYEQYYGDCHEKEAPFYLKEVGDCRGPVLEAGCGTGSLFYKLLRHGVDVHGFDNSEAMLEVLVKNACAWELDQLEGRVTRQELTHFRYDEPFEAILLPARLFLHLTTQEAQLWALQNVHRHLKPGGRLLMNFFAPEYLFFLEYHKQPRWEPFARFIHPETKQTVELHIHRQIDDLSTQLIKVHWRLVQQDGTEETEMLLRWLYRTECELLLQLAGFERWTLYGDFDRSAFDGRSGEMIWVAEKS